MSTPQPEAVPAPEISKNSGVNTVTDPSKSPSGSVDIDRASVFVSTVGELQKKDPKFYKMVVEGYARTIIRQMKAHADRLKKILRDGQSES